ncbi:hypothetical protein Hanom_Chr12g01093631 [Helianthus anomalus]
MPRLKILAYIGCCNIYTCVYIIHVVIYLFLHPHVQSRLLVAYTKVPTGLGIRHQFCHLVSNQLLRRDLVQYEHQFQLMRNMHH